MEKLSILVVVSFLVPDVLSKMAQQYGSPQLSLWTLTVRDQVVSVSQNGTLKSEPYLPTLYSIFRSELYIDENEPYSLPEFSLVGIASGYRLCMDRKGFVYTKKVAKREKRWLKSLPSFGSTPPSPAFEQVEEEDNADDDTDVDGEVLDPREGKYRSASNADSEDLKPQIPPAECLFRGYGFDPAHSYDYRTAIYRASTSRRNSSKVIGNFVAFLKSGETRRYRRPLENLRMHSSIALMFDPIRKPATSSIIARSNFYNTNNNNADKRVENMLSTTQFKYCSSGKPGGKLFNMKVRQCVKAATKSLNISRLNHTNLSKIIQKCLCPLGKICRQDQCVNIESKNNNNKFSKHNSNENRIRKQKHNNRINRTNLMTTSNDSKSSSFSGSRSIQ